ncbi:MAG: hypothetical protein J3K34DRAFT_402694 [Monoraphidium minutum]|nr:MAG: hypothetical protein J3K34DRAFT_402694 [Monoraphidium minutum]
MEGGSVLIVDSETGGPSPLATRPVDALAPAAAPGVYRGFLKRALARAPLASKRARARAWRARAPPIPRHTPFPWRHAARDHTHPLEQVGAIQTRLGASDPHRALDAPLTVAETTPPEQPGRRPRPDPPCLLLAGRGGRAPSPYHSPSFIHTRFPLV